MLDSLAISLQEDRVEVRVPRPLPAVRADRVRVGEIFYNLIVNAMKYNDKADKWIEIGWRENPAGPPVFYVRDNGIGIPEKHHDAMFRIFKRLHGRDKYGGGTGAGLTIVKKIIERHHGRIWLESSAGRGDDASISPWKKETYVPEPPTQPILLVEDSPEDFETTQRAFRRSGLKNPILRCADGDEALDFLFHRGEPTPDAPRPGVILLDLNLPGTDGREVLAEIKASDDLKQIPVIVLTTSADERDVQACYQAGASSYIQKPVDLEGFMKAIERLNDYWFEVVILPKGQ